ncbi:uncharacterized protein LOC125570125 isoform X2 [Nematostella vectensis]|uniref:uncharacterized protein LOC125570125 isoform X2 n=1 Tax=Nematostella vectensis TaxID=45351 RepID=UPI002076F019|nr:uncharacterized protein LOC125570125 isoform X2 [Nematostella vectensis]
MALDLSAFCRFREAGSLYSLGSGWIIKSKALSQKFGNSTVFYLVTTSDVLTPRLVLNALKKTSETSVYTILVDIGSTEAKHGVKTTKDLREIIDFVPSVEAGENLLQDYVREISGLLLISLEKYQRHGYFSKSCILCDRPVNFSSALEVKNDFSSDGSSLCCYVLQEAKPAKTSSSSDIDKASEDEGYVPFANKRLSLLLEQNKESAAFLPCVVVDGDQTYTSEKDVPVNINLLGAIVTDKKGKLVGSLRCHQKELQFQPSVIIKKKYSSASMVQENGTASSTCGDLLVSGYSTSAQQDDIHNEFPPNPATNDEEGMQHRNTKPAHSSRKQNEQLQIAGPLMTKKTGSEGGATTSGGGVTESRGGAKENGDCATGNGDGVTGSGGGATRNGDGVTGSGGGATRNGDGFTGSGGGATAMRGDVTGSERNVRKIEGGGTGSEDVTGSEEDIAESGGSVIGNKHDITGSGDLGGVGGATGSIGNKEGIGDIATGNGVGVTGSGGVATESGGGAIGNGDGATGSREDVTRSERDVTKIEGGGTGTEDVTGSKRDVIGSEGDIAGSEDGATGNEECSTGSESETTESGDDTRGVPRSGSEAITNKHDSGFGSSFGARSHLLPSGLNSNDPGARPKWKGNEIKGNDETKSTYLSLPDLVDTAPHQPDPLLSEIYPQPILPLVETAGSSRRKIRSGDDIQTLWAESPSHTFDKDLSHLLDTEYHYGIESGLQLAKLLGIDGEQRETFTRASISSRSEKLFEILATIQPDLKVKDLSKALEDIKNIAAFNVLEHAKSAKPKDGGSQITDETEMADLLDSHGKVIGQLSLELDKGPQNWKNLSSQLGVPRSYTKQLSRPDSYKSPTREMIEHFIPVRKPSLTVESLVKLFNEKNAPTALVDKLKNLKQDLPIKHLPNKEVMDDLEDYLDAGEWRTVAENLGLCDDDISCIKPIPSREIGVTEAMFVWLRSAKPKTFTVAQLVIQLAKMKRRDCLDLIASQMEDGEVKNILKKAGLEVEGLE